MDIIQLLPDSVANQIAAGEVIERPASVVKELMENAIDAGATKIDVVVTDAGRTLIRVIDNGKGMSPSDARLAFEHHATSKIRKADDLFSLHTMGFRGEALATIAAVAQVELRTRQADDDMGTLINIAGGKVSLQDVVACAKGCCFDVKNIFFNIPARRKFLKSDAAEFNQISTTFERIALVYPEISFTLYSGDVEKYNLRAGSQLQRIVDIFGNKYQHDLVPLEIDTTVCKISGYVGSPTSSKKKGARQYFFVNGRYMKHPYFHRAVQMAVERLVPAGEQVSYFLYINVSPNEIDVNVSPTKTEIKFENEQTLWQILNAAVKEAIGKFSDVPMIDFDSEERPNIPVFNPNIQTTATNITSPFQNVKPTNYNPFNSTPKHTDRKTPTDWEVFYEAAKQPIPKEEASLFPETEKLLAVESSSHFQYKGTYIMTAVKSGLMIIDQHRAHVRILYERFMKLLDNRNGLTQKVLFPEAVSFSQTEEQVLENVSDELSALGFDITPLGGGSFAINGIPAGLEAGLNAVEILQDIVSAMGAAAKEQVNSIIAERLANHAAITYGEVLSEKEMLQLVTDLFLCSNVNYTPSGKVIMTIIDDIESRF